MHKWAKVMGLHWKLLARCLNPIATAHATGFGGKCPLLLPRAQVLDNAVRIDQVKTLILERQPRAVSDDCSLVRLKEQNLVFVKGLDIQDRYLGFDRHIPPRARQPAHIEDAHGLRGGNGVEEMAKTTPPEVRRDLARYFEDGVHDVNFVCSCSY